ncbi:unnamed protein product, partial [Owenia fusiformis]
FIISHFHNFPVTSKRTLWIIGMTFGTIFVITRIMGSMNGSGMIIYYRQRCPEQPDHYSYKNNLLDVPSKYEFSYPLGGMTFTNDGFGRFILRNVTTSLIYAFSPMVDERARKFYLVGARDLIINVNQPTITWHKNHLVTVMRFWINNAIFTLGDSKRSGNKFSDNHLYVQRFNRTMGPLDVGSLVGMVGPKHNIGDGPISPRLFVFNEKLYLCFTLKYQTNTKTYVNGLFLWDFEEHAVIKPTFKGLRRLKRSPKDKHWIPLISKGELYFVYSFDPLRVFRCKLQGRKCTCGFVVFEGDTRKSSVNKDYIQGGTPFVHYKDSYQISIAYSTFLKKTSMKTYFTANLVIICTEPKPRIVYVSAPLRIDNALLLAYPIVRHWNSEDPFFIPFGIILENSDSAVVSGHINEHSGVLIRIRGIQGVIEKAMALDEVHKTTESVPIGSVQTFVGKSAAKRDKLELFD